MLLPILRGHGGVIEFKNLSFKPYVLPIALLGGEFFSTAESYILDNFFEILFLGILKLHLIEILFFRQSFAVRWKIFSFIAYIF